MSGRNPGDAPASADRLSGGRAIARVTGKHSPEIVPSAIYPSHTWLTPGALQHQPLIRPPLREKASRFVVSHAAVLIVREKSAADLSTIPGSWSGVPSARCNQEQYLRPEWHVSRSTHTRHLLTMGKDIRKHHSGIPAIRRTSPSRQSSIINVSYNPRCRPMDYSNPS